MPAVGDLGAVAAKECIEHVLGVDVELLDERRQPGLPDLLYQQQGRTVIGEVKQIVDSNYMSLREHRRRVVTREMHALPDSGQSVSIGMAASNEWHRIL
jgi:hypothetical protein